MDGYELDVCYVDSRAHVPRRGGEVNESFFNFISARVRPLDSVCLCESREGDLMLGTYILTEMFEVTIGAIYALLIFVGVLYLGKAIWVTVRS